MWCSGNRTKELWATKISITVFTQSIFAHALELRGCNFLFIQRINTWFLLTCAHVCMGVCTGCVCVCVCVCELDIFQPTHLFLNFRYVSEPWPLVGFLQDKSACFSLPWPLYRHSSFIFHVSPGQLSNLYPFCRKLLQSLLAALFTPILFVLISPHLKKSLAVILVRLKIEGRGSTPMWPFLWLDCKSVALL